MSRQVRPQLGRLVALPFATAGILSAVLVWEVDHVGSLWLSIAIAIVGTGIGVVVARSARAQIDELSVHYESILKTAEEQSARAEAAGRARDEFLATLSHELRTPLNSILGWSRLLATGKLDADQAANAVRAIERAGWTQSRLIDDLLDISRIVTGRMRITPRATRVEPVIERAVQAIRPAAEAKAIVLETVARPSVGTISADADRLQQIVWNLLSNAVKFTPPGGRVLISVENVDQDVVITVSDTGLGFQPGTAEHLFERFRQADSSTTRHYPGLGLGLGIVRYLVELHGGTVTARSAGIDQGAAFIVRLPARPGAEPAADLTPPPDHAPLLRGVSVLLVDDDPAALHESRASLEKFGAIVRTASSAREARDRFRREPPDVLLSDLVLPDEDGLELIRQIRQLESGDAPPTPAAALTSLARAEDRRRALTAGYQLHLAKPVDPQELAAVVQRLAKRDDTEYSDSDGNGRAA